MTPLKTPVAFTANRLSDGEVVWLGANGKWVEAVEASLALTSVEDRDVAEAVAQKADADNYVVEPYAIDVSVDGGVVTPTKFRERIRATGPTIRLDLGKQAAGTARAA